MNFQEILNDKSVKPKEKTEMLSQLVLNNSNIIDELIAFAKESKDPIKATIIESFEFATKLKPELANKNLLQFASNSLTEKAPRVKWESAKVIGNISHLYPKQLEESINHLLVNTEVLARYVKHLFLFHRSAWHLQKNLKQRGKNRHYTTTVTADGKK